MNNFAKPLFCATIVVCLLLSAAAQAELLGVQEHHEAGSHNVEVNFSVPLKLGEVLPSENRHELKLTLTAQDDKSFLNWSSSRIDIDEPDSPVTSVILEGKRTTGIELRIEFKKTISAELLPQYTDSHVLLAIADDRRRAKQQPPSTNKKFAINLESRQASTPTLADVPQTLALDRTIYITSHKKDGEVWQRLRVGFWDNKKDAEAAVTTLKQRFPSAWVIEATTLEISSARASRLNPEIALARAGLKTHDTPANSVNVQIEKTTPSSINDFSTPVVSQKEWSDRPEALASTGKEPAQEDRPEPSKPDTKPTPIVAIASAKAGTTNSSAAKDLRRSADSAFRKKDYRTAIQRYQELLDMGDTLDRAHGLEMLGTAQELSGLRTDAQDTYQRYLDSYADLSGARRVRQRLNTLLSLLATSGRQVLKEGNRDITETDWIVNHSLSQFYQRHSLTINNDQTVPINGIFSDYNLSAQKSSGAFDHRARFAVSYLHDFSGNLRSNRDFRISNAYWDSHYSPWKTSVRVGRQSRYDAGVIGRFDGVVAERQITDHIATGIVGGFLLDTSFDAPNTDRPFYGAFVNYRSDSGAFQLSPFILQQKLDGQLDRRAVGFQSQWVKDSTNALAIIDYDIYHSALNNVMLQVNLGVGKRNSFNVSFDQRRSPYLTTRNALIGQPFEELNDLEAELIDISLRDLASDRTAKTTAFRAGWNRKVSKSWEFSTDVMASDLSSTESSQNVIGYGSRQDIYYSMQLRAHDFFGAGTYSALQFRHAAGEDNSSSTIYLNNRLNLGERYWLYPRLRYDYRKFDTSGQTQHSVRPSMRLDYRHDKRLRLELEAGYEWTTRETSNDDIDISGLFVRAGYRMFF